MALQWVFKKFASLQQIQAKKLFWSSPLPPSPLHQNFRLPEILPKFACNVGSEAQSLMAVPPPPDTMVWCPARSDLSAGGVLSAPFGDDETTIPAASYFLIEMPGSCVISVSKTRPFKVKLHSMKLNLSRLSLLYITPQNISKRSQVTLAN